MLCSLSHLQQQAGSLLIISCSLKFVLGIEIAKANQTRNGMYYVMV